MTALPTGLTRPRHAVAPTPTEPPVGPLLRDPSAFIHSFIHRGEVLLAAYGWASGILIACTFIAALMLRYLWWRRFHARLADGARQITVLAPPRSIRRPPMNCGPTSSGCSARPTNGYLPVSHTWPGNTPGTLPRSRSGSGSPA